MHRSARIAWSWPLAAAMLLGLAAPATADTPAQRLEQLRAEASRLHDRVERTNHQVAELVDAHNASQVKLDETKAAEARTHQRLTAADARLERARERLGDRVRAIYVNRDGPIASVEQFLGGRTPHEAITTLTYQQRVVERDQELIEDVTAGRAALARSAGELRRRRAEQERLGERLAEQKGAIQERLAEQRAELARVSAGVRQALDEQHEATERRRQAVADAWASSHEPATAGAPGGAAAKAVAWALQQVGKPYRWGASGLSTYDCSGLTMRAYHAAGVTLPRTSRSQWAVGARVDRAALQPGDLLFYGGSPSSISHVGMYVGSGRMVEAPYTGATVRVASIFRGNYLGARRPTA